MDSALVTSKLVALGVVNDTFDFAVTNWFDMTVLRQKSRELGKVIGRVNLINDGVNAQLVDLNDYLKSARRHAKTLDLDITAILTDEDPENDADATILQAELTPLLAEIEKREKRQATAQQNLNDNVEMIRFLSVRLKEVNSKVIELTEAKDETKTLNQAADAVEQTKDILEDTSSFNNIGSQIMAKNGRARQRYARVVGSVQEMSNQDSTMASARLEIARRKATLNSKSE